MYLIQKTERYADVLQYKDEDIADLDDAKQSSDKAQDFQLVDDLEWEDKHEY